ncbi:beta strand repeat-containing protein [Terriglobus roseus]|nr:IPT/TIG domain-containing protein [Terriglobus roseus]
MKHFFARPAASLCLIAFVLPVSLLGCASGSGGGSSNTTTTTTTPTTTTLSVSAVSPTDVPVGSNDTTVVVTGTGFTTSSVISLNNLAETTTFVSSTEVHAVVPSAQLKTGAVLSVSVANGSTVAKLDPAVAALSVDNPVPSLTLVAPTAVLMGSTAASITVTGTNFVPGVALSVNGSPRTTTFVSDTQLTAALTADDFATARSLPLNVINPKPGGGTSGTSALTVTNPLPSLTSLSLTSIVQGSAPPTLTLTGSNFVATSTVLVNGAVHSSTYVGPTKLTVTLSSADLTNATTLPIAVANPVPGGGTSASLPFVVIARLTSPSIYSVVPGSFYSGMGDTTINVFGTGLAATSTLQWNGAIIASTYSTGTVYVNGYAYTSGPHLTGVIPANLLATAGNAAVTVTTSTYPTPTSNTLTVTIADPPAPTITSLSPNYVPINTSATVAIYGTGFTSRSTATFNGLPLPVTYNSSGYLTATIPAGAIAFPGNGSIQVSTAAPGGGTSASSLLTAYVPVVSNNMVYNAVNGLLYLSIPSAGSTVSGNSIVSMDPATGALGTPIYVGSEPGAMTISDDGKSLWVALNGTNAVRKVDLLAGVAGAQFSLSALGNSSTNLISAMLVLPGTTDSVAITNSYQLGLYDGGVLRGTAVGVNSAYAIQADGSRNELYLGGSTLQTFTYASGGLTSKYSGSYNSSYIATSGYDEMQLATPKLFTDYGRVLDPESGSLLGTFMNGTYAASGPSLYDAALSKFYVLDTPSSSCCSYSQIQVFNPANYTDLNTPIAINVPSSIYNAANQYVSLNPHRLVRWGVNGLALHTKAGVFSLQSNSVKDLSATSADLSVTLSASGGITTGSTATYIATIKNTGPSAATDVALVLQAPSTGVLQSAVSSVGACPSLSGCILGTLAKNGTATVTITVLQTTAGTASLAAQVRGSSTDPSTSDNSASAAITVTGTTYNLAPALVSLSPSTIRVGGGDTTITVTGSNFTSASTVNLGATPLTTTFLSTTQLTATIPSANLSSLGWAPVSVTSPAPGGGSTASLPLTIYNVLTVGLKHVVYEPYTRKLIASVSSGSSTVTGSSLVTLDPATGTFGTPVTLSNAPNQLALSDSGKTLWATLGSTNTNTQAPSTLERVDLTKTTSDAYTTVTVPNSMSYSPSIVPMVAIQPGTEDTLAMAPTSYGNIGIYDYAASSNTLAVRANANSLYNYSSCNVFLDPANLLTVYYGWYDFPVSSAGIGTVKTISTSSYGCFRLYGAQAYLSTGQIYAVTPTSATQTGAFTLPSTSSYSSNGLPALSVDASLKTAFYPVNTLPNSSFGYVDGLGSYDTQSYLRTGLLPLNIPGTEGSAYYNIAINDVVRWGQDGLAVVTDSGHIYLLRGPFVVPQELNTNTAAVLTSSSITTVTHGASNTLLTLTGSNFVPGVAVTWNGSYRTTTIVDATHVTVAIPASDLAAAGSGSLVATNPGAGASSSLTISIQ